jgi:hypothetical protein
MNWDALKMHLNSKIDRSGPEYSLEITPRPMTQQQREEYRRERKVWQKKDVSLQIVSANPENLTFSSLGNGCMKRAVRVVNNDWALLFGTESIGAEQDMEGEVGTLLDLGTKGVRVPAPFNGNWGRNDIIFKLNIAYDVNEAKLYPAFLEQLLPYVEMDKQSSQATKESYARDNIMTNGIVPPTVSQTVDDLAAILKALQGHEWGDFQVMYDNVNGYVYVFDPLPNNNTRVEVGPPLVKRWLRDIAEVIRASLTATSAQQTVAEKIEGWERRGYPVGGW